MKTFACLACVCSFLVLSVDALAETPEGALSVPDPSELLEGTFNEADTDSDGKLHMNEVMAWGYNPLADLGDNEQDKIIVALTNAFGAADKSSQGYLKLEDFQGFLNEVHANIHSQ